MTANSSPAGLGTLTCGHVVMYCPQPRLKDVLWCRYCTGYRTCVAVTKAWRMVCETCKLAHQYGLDEQRIRRTAVRHLRLYPDHEVTITNGMDVKEKINSGQDPLGFVTEP